jgi:iron complex outermembrane receptor protein
MLRSLENAAVFITVERMIDPGGAAGPPKILHLSDTFRVPLSLLSGEPPSVSLYPVRFFNFLLYGCFYPSRCVPITANRKAMTPNRQLKSSANRPPSSPKPARLTTAGVLACLALTATLHAQTSNTSAAPDNAKDENVTTLSEFDVKPNTTGYVPTESSTGSRMNISVKNLPFSVTGITSDYIKDFGIFEFGDELAFSSSLSGLNDSGGFNLRGFSGNITLRNGYSRLGVFDPSSYDRVEVIKGPAAAVYGQTNPGGIVNYITKTPRNQPFQSLSQAYGSYSLSRTDLEASGPIPTSTGDSKLYYVVAASHSHRFYEGPAQAREARTVYTDMIYKFTPSTSLSFDFDYDYTDFLGGTSGPSLPEVFDINPAKVQNTTTNVPKAGVSSDQYTGLAWSLVKKYYTEPSNYNHRTIFNYESFFESELTDHLSLKVGGDIYRSPRFTYSTNISGQYDPTTGNLIGRSGKTSFNLLEGDGQSGSVDLLAHYDIPGQGEQKTLFTTDYYKNIGKRPLWATPAGTTATTFNVNHPVFTPFIPFFNQNPAENYTIQTNAGGFLEDDYAASTGFSLRHQGDFLNDKVIVAVGVRRDSVREFKESLVNGVMTTSLDYYTPAAWTEQFGLGYKVRPDTLVYANRTESFVPNSPSQVATGITYFPNQTGTGYEVGVKTDALDDRLNFTADVYTTTLHGVLVTSVDPVTGSTETVAAGTQKSKGVEFDGNWQVTPTLRTLLSYSYDIATYGNQGVDLDLAGRQVSGIPRNILLGAVTWNVYQGLTLTANARYYSTARVDNTAGTPKVNGFQINSDGRRDLVSPSYAVCNVGAFYNWRNGTLSQRVQVDLKNILDKEYVIVGSRIVGDRFGVYVSYSIAH